MGLFLFELINTRINLPRVSYLTSHTSSIFSNRIKMTIEERTEIGSKLHTLHYGNSGPLGPGR
jgi:hypothetical protein